jgi:hypothetical protein
MLHFTTDSEEKHHGNTRQEVSYEVRRQHRKKARRRKNPRRRETRQKGRGQESRRQTGSGS